MHELPPLHEHAWYISGDGLKPVWMTKESAPHGLTERTLCHCKKHTVVEQPAYAERIAFLVRKHVWLMKTVKTQTLRYFIAKIVFMTQKVIRIR